MSKIALEFNIDRGIVSREDVDDDYLSDFDKVIELCSKDKHAEAVKFLLPKLTFEWNWSNCDGDPSETFKTKDISFECCEQNCSLRVGVYEGLLVVSVSVFFEVESIGAITAAEIEDWISEKALWCCGFVSAGWSYSGSDGDNVWLRSIDGQPVGEEG